MTHSSQNTQDSITDHESAAAHYDLSQDMMPNAPDLVIDEQAWEEFLSLCDGPQEEKEAFIRALYALICEFVAMGFGVHPLQEHHVQDGDITTLLSPAMLDSLQSDNSENEGETL